MLNQVSNRGAVYKARRLFVCSTCHPGAVYENSPTPWVGKHPYMGVQRFGTQREAFDFANARLSMFNGPTVARQYGVILR